MILTLYKPALLLSGMEFCLRDRIFSEAAEVKMHFWAVELRMLLKLGFRFIHTFEWGLLNSWIVCRSVFGETVLQYYYY